MAVVADPRVRQLRAIAHRHRYLLTLERGALEARCPEREPLWTLIEDLERLGHRFVRLERLPAGQDQGAD